MSSKILILSNKLFHTVKQILNNLLILSLELVFFSVKAKTWKRYLVLETAILGLYFIRLNASISNI